MTMRSDAGTSTTELMRHCRIHLYRWWNCGKWCLIGNNLPSSYRVETDMLYFALLSRLCKARLCSRKRKFQ